MEKVKVRLKKFLLSLKDSFKKNKKEWQIFALVLLVAVIIGLISLSGYYFFISRKKGEKLPKVATEVINVQKNNDQKIAEKKTRRLIDGVLVESGAENVLPAGIMIDNFTEARPPSGLNKASLIFEAPTEAGIPRFLAVYATNEEIKEIGPVRSARSYYLDWIKEFHGMYLHVGGSEEALWKIKKYNIFDLNEYYNEWYYWRDPNRARPHNVYTSSELIKKALKDRRAEELGDYRAWDFKDDALMNERGQDGQKISFNFSSRFGADYAVDWQYNQSDNNYQRFQAGNLHQEKDGSLIKTKNVIVQFCAMEILDEVGRRKINTVGEGDALIFRDGQVIKGKWRKTEMGERTVYYYNDDGDRDEDDPSVNSVSNENEVEDIKELNKVKNRPLGEDYKVKNKGEVEFNAGTTWVEVLPVGSQVNYY